MCGRSYARRGVGFGPGRRYMERRRGGRGESFGMGVEELGPGTRIVVALSVLVPVVLSGVFLVAFAPSAWWIFTTYGWVALPAFGLFVRGVAGLSERKPREVPAETGERELLRALKEHGELTPALAAMETSLSVDAADGMLRKLAEGGHLEVRVRGGTLTYAPWDASGRDVIAMAGGGPS